MGSSRFFMVMVTGWMTLSLASSVCAQTLDTAQPPTETSQGLAGLTRIPGRFIDPARVPANVTVITAEDIKQWGVTTIQEAIARAEGVTHLDRLGFGIGSDTTLNLRGVVNSSRTNALVLLDGIQQNQFTGDEVHWQSIPLHSIERIEIIRGGGGIIYGEGALSGVINILTRKGGPERLKTHFRTEIGSFGWERYSLDMGGSEKRLRYRFGYDRRMSDGWRESSQSRNTTISTHTGIKIAPGVDLSVNILHSEDTTEFPGGLTLEQSQNRDVQAISFLQGVFDDETDQVSVDLVLGPYRGSTWLLNTYWRRRTSDSLRSGLYTTTPSRGLSLRNTYEWIGNNVYNTLISGFELVDEKATTGTRGGSPQESNHEGYGTYVENTLTLWDRLSLVAGFRYDKSKFEEDVSAFDVSTFTFVQYTGTLSFEGKSPKLGARLNVIPGHFDVFTSFSRPFKAPNVDDFASRTTEFSGNVSLSPQQGNNYEVGAVVTAGPVSINGTWFHSKVDDEILFIQGIPGNPFIFQNQNHDTIRNGFETAFKVDLPEKGLNGYLTYTFVDAKFRKGQFSGNTLPATPEHTLNAGISYAPTDRLRANLDWQLLHDYVRINDVANTLPRGDNFGVLNLTLYYDFLKASAGSDQPEASAFLKFINLTSEEYVSFQASNGSTLTGAGENPMPPLQVVTGMLVDF